MSQTEFHTGRLIPASLEGTTLKDKCKEIAEKYNVEFKDSDNWIESFMDNFDKHAKRRNPERPELFIHEEKLYVVSNHFETSDEEYFMKLFPKEDGTIDFVGQFYNGGTCFSEMLEESLTELNKNSNKQFETIL
jgi:hypothetical protein